MSSIITAAGMPAIIPFNFEGAEVRVLERNGNPWWIHADVCTVLEIRNSRDAAERLDDDEKGVAITDTLGGPQEMAVINESGLWSLVLTSRKPAAKRFKKWITSEVIPAIRKTGGYMMAAPEETPEEIMLRALTIAKETVDRQKAQLAEAQPKADAHDRIAGAEGSLNITEAAKALQVRPKALFDWLSRNGWIYRRGGASGWLGYQAHTSNGDLEHKVTTVQRSDGSEKVSEQVRVTPKGLTRLAKLMAT